MLCFESCQFVVSELSRAARITSRRVILILASDSVSVNSTNISKNIETCSALLCQLPVCCFRASPRRLVQSCTADRSPFGQNFGKYSKIVSTVEGFASLLYQHFRFRLVEDTFVITQSGAGKSQTIL